MKALRMRMIGKVDRNKDDYYYTTTSVPALIDLSNAVIHFYPDQEDDGSFGGELVIRHYDPKKSNSSHVNTRKRRRSRVTDGESLQEGSNADLPGEEDEEDDNEELDIDNED